MHMHAGGHHHDHNHDHSSKNLGIAFFLNLFFSIVEFIGGWWTNSVAIYSDAIHDLGDSLSLGAAWYFQRISRKDRTKNFSYGFRRFSVLGSIINAIVLVVGSIIILTESIPRLFDPVQPNAEGMIYLAIAGIIINIIAATRISKGHSLNEKVVYLHLLEDVLGWTATLIAAIIMQFKSLPQLDPILSIGISIFILYNVFKNLSKAIKIILQGTPEEIDPDAIHKALKSIPEIKETHDCHIWSMDGQYHILSIHAIVDDNKGMDELASIKSKAKALLKDHHIDHATIEFETSKEKCDPC
ncbi:MAG: cation diffusion facilitator family transporter [Bacteroidota bacterium]